MGFTTLLWPRSSGFTIRLIDDSSIQKSLSSEILDKKLKNNNGLIRPMKKKTDPEVGIDALMVMIPSDLDYLVKLHRAEEITRFCMDFFNLYLVKDGEKPCLSLAGPFLGAPPAVMGMEKLIALGAKRLWVIGWCGSLIPDLRIGDLVIPTRAMSEEGTSQHYPINEKVLGTDEGLDEMIEQALRGKGQAFKKGAVWTTDAPYRETPAKVREYQDRGAIAVEMEMSALMTLAIYRNVRLSGLLVVSDELFDLKWHPGFSTPGLKKMSRLAGEILLEMVDSLNG
ncbi:MAG: nucleoside phosphorylase [Deltaproteobacteria bacterium]|nr:nucleoside phosphorylase [Deltaproteobacteria bacterium]